MTDRPIRVQRKRTTGWKMPPNTVSVTRPGKWGNPYKAEPELRCEGVFMPAVTREDAVRLHRENLTARITSFPSVLAELQAELRGRNLACWCPVPVPGDPDICHAATLLEIANPAISFDCRKGNVDAV